MSCSVGQRHGVDLVLLWLWRRPAAVALIRPLAWEPPHVMGAALKSKTKQKNCPCSYLRHVPPLVHPGFHIYSRRLEGFFSRNFGEGLSSFQFISISMFLILKYLPLVPCFPSAIHLFLLSLLQQKPFKDLPVLVVSISFPHSLLNVDPTKQPEPMTSIFMSKRIVRS